MFIIIVEKYAADGHKPTSNGNYIFIFICIKLDLNHSFNEIEQQTLL